MSLARTLARVAEVALEPLAPAEYDRSLFEALADAVGFDVGLLKRGHALSSVSPGLDRRVAADCVDAWPAFARDARPVQRAAALAGDVAVDLDVLGARALERSHFYQRLMRPHHGSCTALLFLRSDGGPEATTLLALGRSSRARFTQVELARLRCFAPILALAEGRLARLPMLAPSLTPREHELLEYLPLGYTNAQIADALGTKTRTVRNQLTRLFDKLGVDNRTEAVGLLASRPGLRRL